MGETLLEVEGGRRGGFARRVGRRCVRLAGAKGGGGGGNGAKGGGGGGDPAVGRPSTMVERAKKQAHFAQRDVELTQQKKAAEKRKQEYMKSIGGMEAHHARWR